MLSGLIDLAKAFLQAFHSASFVVRYVKRLSCPYGLNSCMAQKIVFTYIFSCRVHTF